MGGRSLNTQAAEIFRDCAGILRQQKANPFRVNAYMRAAQTLESLDFDVADLLADEGIEGLIELPTIGRGLATAIDEIARTGRLAQLDRLRGEARPEVLFQSLPGVGPTLATRIHDMLHVDTLEALELAAHDGSLAVVPGIGERRAAAIRAGITAMLRSGAQRGSGLPQLLQNTVRKRSAPGTLYTLIRSLPSAHSADWGVRMTLLACPVPVDLRQRLQ